MNGIREEYLGATNGNGNGNGNANGHTKIFDLAPKQDPMLSVYVPAARRKVCQNTKICEAARMFFCWLTDMSLLPGVNTRKGVVRFSDRDLAIRFRRNEKTIRNWKRAVESTGEVWTNEKWMKNSFPLTIYNITCIVGQATLPMNIESEDGNLPDDEIFSSNRRRLQVAPRSRESGKFVCRLHGLANCQDCRRITPPGVPVSVATAVTPQKTEENGSSGKILPPTTAIDCRPPRQLVAAHHGNTLPSPTAIDCREARQLVAAEHGNRLPRPAAIGCRGERQTVADNGETGGKSLSNSGGKGEALPTEKQFQDWLRSLDGMYTSRLKDLERTFTMKIQKAQSPEAKSEWKRRLAIVQERLLGGPVEDRPLAKRVRKDPRPQMSPEQMKKLWDAEKQKLPANVRARAAR